MLAISIMAFCGLVSAVALAAAVPSWASPLTTVGIMPIITFVGVLVHEMGHFFAGKIVRAKIRSIYIMPFLLGWPLWSINIQWRLGGHDIGGYVNFSTMPSSKLGRAFIFSAGPLANLIVTVSFTMVALYLSETSILFYLLVAISWTSAGLGIANLIPFHGSDGAKLFALFIKPRLSAASARTRSHS